MFASATIDVHALTKKTDIEVIRQHLVSCNAVGPKQ